MAQVAPVASEKVRTARLDTLTEADWVSLKRAIVVVRSPFLISLIALNPDWYVGRMSLDAVAAMRFANSGDWPQKWPSRVFGDLAGVRHLPGRAPEFRGFRTAIERPIAVGPALDGPFCLMEGYARLACVLRDHRAGIRNTTEAEIFVGVTRLIETEWTNTAGNHRWW